MLHVTSVESALLVDCAGGLEVSAARLEHGVCGVALGVEGAGGGVGVAVVAEGDDAGGGAGGGVVGCLGKGGCEGACCCEEGEG